MKAKILLILRRRIYKPYPTLNIINAFVHHCITIATTSKIAIRIVKITATNITITVIANWLLLRPRPFHTLILLEVFVAKCQLGGLRSQHYSERKWVRNFVEN